MGHRDGNGDSAYKYKRHKCSRIDRGEGKWLYLLLAVAMYMHRTDRYHCEVLAALTGKGAHTHVFQGSLEGVSKPLVIGEDCQPFGIRASDRFSY